MVTGKPALQAAEICTLKQVVCSTELGYPLEKVGLIPCEIHMENGIYLAESYFIHGMAPHLTDCEIHSYFFGIG